MDDPPNPTRTPIHHRQDPDLPRPLQGRGRRVAADQVSHALDEIVSRLQLDHVYPLHRHVAELAGVHPTTVMRYHNADLYTASEKLCNIVADLLEKVRAGETMPFAQPRKPASGGGVRSLGSRVPSGQVREELDAIQRLLDKDETQFLYRYVAENTGLHPSSVRRYHRGELRTAPASLLGTLGSLRARLESGEPVAFLRSPGGETMVDRAHTLEALEALLAFHTDQPKVRMFQQLDERLGFKRGTVNRIYYDRKVRFVRASVHKAIERLASANEYDPCRVYEIGERIDHHMFGVGVVRRKIHKNKIEVEFAEEKRIILAEAVPIDPFLRYRFAS